MVVPDWKRAELSWGEERKEARRGGGGSQWDKKSIIERTKKGKDEAGKQVKQVRERKGGGGSQFSRKKRMGGREGDNSL